jgi:steroid delta-isomerase-like uncharacterized protein
MSIKEINKERISHFYHSIREVSYLRTINEVGVRETGIINSIRNIFAEVYASDCLIHNTKGDSSLEEVIMETASYFAAFPDTKTIVEDMIADGDKVVTRWTMQNTHKDILHGSQTTGKKNVINGITLRRIANGKVIEEWSLTDMPSVISQVDAFLSQQSSNI